MKRAVLVVVAVVACCQMRSFAQAPIALTGKIKALEGHWTRDATQGIDYECFGDVDHTIRIRVSESEVRIETSRASGGLTSLVKLDGGVTAVSDGRAASASLDAGWLVVTMRRQRPTQVNVTRDVYTLGNDELTVWRSFNVEYPDGTQGSVTCSRQAIVYQRQRQP